MYGLRKQVQVQHGIPELGQKLEDLRKNKAKLEARKLELQNKLEAVEKRNKEKRKLDDEKRAAELDFLKYQENHLSQFLTAIQDAANPK